MVIAGLCLLFDVVHRIPLKLGSGVLFVTSRNLYAMILEVVKDCLFVISFIYEATKLQCITIYPLVKAYIEKSREC